MDASAESRCVSGCSSMRDTMQVKVSKSNAIERLSALRDAVEGLRVLDASSPGFLRWYEDVKGTFKYVFGQKSDEMESLLAIWHTPMVRNTGTSEDARIENERNRLEAFQKGLVKYAALIASQIHQVSAFWPDDEVLTRRETVGEGGGPVDSKQVFVVHGRDQGALAEVKQVLSQLGLEPVVLQDLHNKGRTIIEKFEDHAQVGFAVVVCTPDDAGKLADGDTQPQPRVRQNVIFELGYFLGKLGRAKVCTLIKGVVEVPSDYYGVVYVEMDDKRAWRFELIRELKEAQFDVDANDLV